MERPDKDQIDASHGCTAERPLSQKGTDEDAVVKRETEV